MPRKDFNKGMTLCKVGSYKHSRLILIGRCVSTEMNGLPYETPGVSPWLATSGCWFLDPRGQNAAVGGLLPCPPPQHREVPPSCPPLSCHANYIWFDFAKVMTLSATEQQLQSKQHRTQRRRMHSFNKECRTYSVRQQEKDNSRRRGRTWEGGLFNDLRSWAAFSSAASHTHCSQHYKEHFPHHFHFVVLFASTQFAAAAPSLFNLYLATGSQPTIRERHHEMPSRDVIIIAQMSAICLRW